MGGANLAAIRDTEIHAQITVPKTNGPVTSSVTIRTMGTRSLRVEGTYADGPGVFTVNDQGAYGGPAGGSVGTAVYGPNRMVVQR